MKIIHSSYIMCDYTDIDECAVNNGGCNADANCTNLAGSFSCACTNGYTGNGFSCTNDYFSTVRLLKSRPKLCYGLFTHLVVCTIQYP